MSAFAPTGRSASCLVANRRRSPWRSPWAPDRPSCCSMSLWRAWIRWRGGSFWPSSSTMSGLDRRDGPVCRRTSSPTSKQACDQLVVLTHGRLAYQAPVADARAGHRTVAVEADAPPLAGTVGFFINDDGQKVALVRSTDPVHEAGDTR